MCENRCSVTEILDVAPVEFFSMLGVSEDFGMPEGMLPPPQVASQAIDFRIYWVSEAGPPTTMKLTSNIHLVPTVRFDLSSSSHTTYHFASNIVSHLEMARET